MQYRSRVADEKEFVVHGYQADIDSGPRFTGMNYEEGGRTFLAQRGERVAIGKDGKKAAEAIGDKDELQKKVRAEDWNDYVIIAEGHRLRHFVNGTLLSEVIDDQEGKAASSGVLAIQLHSGPPMKVQLKDIRLKEPEVARGRSPPGGRARRPRARSIEQEPFITGIHMDRRLRDDPGRVHRPPGPRVRRPRRRAAARRRPGRGVRARGPGADRHAARRRGRTPADRRRRRPGRPPRQGRLPGDRGPRDAEAGLPVDEATIYRIASMTKPVTSVAVMMLLEEGKLGLDDPVSRYLPEFRAPTVLCAGPRRRRGAATVPARREITIRDLLTHTSGLSYRFLDRPGLGRLYAASGVSDGLSETPGTVADNVGRLARLPLLHQPGTAWEYGLSTDVLGRVVEVASGRTLDEFFRERIFGPLRMEDTSFVVPEAKRHRLAALYTPGPDKAIRRVGPGPVEAGALVYSATYPTRDGSTYFSGGAGLCSTIGDYARFLQMLLNRGELDGVRLLKPETVELMTAQPDRGPADRLPEPRRRVRLRLRRADGPRQDRGVPAGGLRRRRVRRHLLLGRDLQHLLLGGPRAADDRDPHDPGLSRPTTSSSARSSSGWPTRRRPRRADAPAEDTPASPGPPAATRPGGGRSSPTPSGWRAPGATGSGARGATSGPTCRTSAASSRGTC